jgi:hypothetical protein
MTLIVRKFCASHLGDIRARFTPDARDDIRESVANNVVCPQGARNKYL